MVEAFDSEWYMAVNERNAFTLVQGVSRTAIDSEQLVAELFVDGGARAFATVRASVGEKAKVIGTVTRNEPGAEPLPIRGYHFQVGEDVLGERLRPAVDVAIVLTDGWTTIGIAKAAWE